MAIYMKFGDVKGQVTTEGFKDWIECSSFQLGIGRSVSTGAGGAQRESSHPNISEITITKVNDKASPKLMEDAVAGHFDTKVELKFTATTKNKVDTFLAYELSHCGVSGFSTHSGGENPVESLTLNFTKIMVTPTSFGTDGKPGKGDIVTYDLIAMKTS